MPDPATFGRRVDYGFQEAAGQLGEYFAGQRGRFTLRIRPEGSDFQRRVWQVVAAIPYGQTRTYGQLAEAVGRPDRIRAVGAANGRNPLAIVVPLPPGGRRRRRPHRVCRWAGPQAVPARPGAPLRPTTGATVLRRRPHIRPARDVYQP